MIKKTKYQNAIFKLFSDKELLRALSKFSLLEAVNYMDIIAMPSAIAIIDRKLMSKKDWSMMAALRDEIGDVTPWIIIDDLDSKRFPVPYDVIHINRKEENSITRILKVVSHILAQGTKIRENEKELIRLSKIFSEKYPDAIIDGIPRYNYNNILWVLNRIKRPVELTGNNIIEYFSKLIGRYLHLNMLGSNNEMRKYEGYLSEILKDWEAVLVLTFGIKYGFPNIREWLINDYKEHEEHELRKEKSLWFKEKLKASYRFNYTVELSFLLDDIGIIAIDKSWQDNFSEFVDLDAAWNKFGKFLTQQIIYSNPKIVIGFNNLNYFWETMELKPKVIDKAELFSYSVIDKTLFIDLKHKMSIFDSELIEEYYKCLKPVVEKWRYAYKQRI